MERNIWQSLSVLVLVLVYFVGRVSVSHACMQFNSLAGMSCANCRAYPLGFALRYLQHSEALRERNFLMYEEEWEDGVNTMQCIYTLPPYPTHALLQVPAGDINGVWLMRLDFSDLWEDARMPEVLRYLYGCKDLLVKLPEPLKQKVASGLACA